MREWGRWDGEVGRLVGGRGWGGGGLRTQTKGGNRTQLKDFDWIDLPVLVCRW